jgi:outer membrane protein assembly complex protein YaeT
MERSGPLRSNEAAPFFSPNFFLLTLHETTWNSFSPSLFMFSSVQGETLVRWLTPHVALGLVLACALPTPAQTHARSAEFPPESRLLTEAFAESLSAKESPTLETVQFMGLRHISSAAVLAQISLRAGDRFDAAKLQHDVRTLGSLGWFASIRVEEVPEATPRSGGSQRPRHVTLLFHFEEQPILSGVEYGGSRLLSTKQIEKLLEGKKLAPGLGKPADPAALQRIAETIRAGLAELAHPEASVRIHPEMRLNATVAVHFEIADGPHLPVRRVRFVGDPRVPEKLLRGQMQSIAPWKPLASLRSKDAYFAAAFEEDRQRILAYYLDHGYPEARLGNAQLTKFTDESWKFLPRPHRAAYQGLQLSIPINAGPFYRLAAVEPTESLQHAIASRSGKPLQWREPEQGHAFSQQEVDKLRRFYTAQLRARPRAPEDVSFQAVDAVPLFDTENHCVRLRLAVSDSPPYLVRRLEFQGLHKFSDRFARRRIPLREGHPLDERALEAGLTKLARTGYFKPIRKENVHIQLDDAHRAADITIRLEEIGQQRATLDGGHAQFGSTLGFAYTVFDFFGHEELLNAKLEGGPETLQIILGVAKEGIFGTRGSLAFSVFDNVLRPRFIHGVQGPFPASHSVGVNIPWTYAVTNQDTVGLTYSLARNTSDNLLGAPPNSSSNPPGSNSAVPLDLRAHTSSRALTAAWAHDTGNERLLFSNSASGSFLGGDEHMLRSSAEAARLFRDPLFSPANAWAFRTTFSAEGSYRGDAPLYSRFFSGDDFVRGLRPGELGPLAMTQRVTPSLLTTYAPSPAGANLITAANVEYRVPLGEGVKADGFFDLGSGRLLPNWLGPAKPTLLTATNGVLHGSTGVELTWTIPGVQVPLRSYYAFNVLRLNRAIRLSNKSFLRAGNGVAAFGWGLGPLF